jgi:hypothetical protein
MAGRLAGFLCEKLALEGFRTEEPLAEDWGWLIDVANDGFNLWIGCGRYTFASSNHTRRRFAGSSERSIRESRSVRFSGR